MGYPNIRAFTFGIMLIANPELQLLLRTEVLKHAGFDDFAIGLA